MRHDEYGAKCFLFNFLIKKFFTHTYVYVYGIHFIYETVDGACNTVYILLLSEAHRNVIKATHIKNISNKCIHYTILFSYISFESNWNESSLHHVKLMHPHTHIRCRRLFLVKFEYYPIECNKFNTTCGCCETVKRHRNIYLHIRRPIDCISNSQINIWKVFSWYDKNDIRMIY